MKIFTHYFIRFCFPVFLFFFSSSSLFKAADYYWIGGAGNWNDLNHWATSSGNTTSLRNVVPSPTDNVYFDQNSGFTSSSNTVYIDAEANCFNITISGCAVPPTITGSYSSKINIYGSTSLQSGMLFKVMSTYFMPTGNATITTNGVKVGWFSSYLNGNGTLNLTDETDFAQNFYIQSGNLNTNNQTVRVGGYFFFTTGGPKTANFGSSHLYMNDFISSESNSTINFGTSTIHLSYNSGTVGLRGKPSDVFYDVIFENVNGNGELYGGATFHNVTFLGNGLFYNNNTFNQLTLSGGKNYNFYVNSTQNVNTKLIASSPSCQKWISLFSSNSGTQANINFASTASIDFNQVILKDMKALGSGIPVSINDSFDNGNNTNFLFNTTTTKNLYWVNGSGNWSDKSHWSLTSGGSGGDCVPGPNDNVFFNSASGLISGNATVTVDIESYCRDITFSGVPTSPTITGYTPYLNIFGSAELQSGMTYSVYNTNFLPANEATLKSNGVKIGSTQVNLKGAGTLKLLDAANFNSSFYIYSGTFTTNNQEFRIGQTISDIETGALKTLNFGSSNIYIGYSLTTKQPNTVVNAGTSHIYFSGIVNDPAFLQAKSTDVFYDVTFLGESSISRLYGGAKFNNVEFKGNGDIRESTTFNQLKLSPSKSYTFYSMWNSSTTQTIQSKLIANSPSCGGWINLQSGNAGTRHKFFFETGATAEINRVIIKDFEAAGFGVPITANGSVDLGNNVGWNFATNTSQDLYWVGGSGNWSDPSHWATSSGGTGNCVPGPADNVFFDQNSGFGSTNKTVTVDVDSYCKNITVAGSATPPIITGASGKILTIFGNTVLQTGMEFSIPNVNFSTTSAASIKSNGVKISTYSASFIGFGDINLLDNAYFGGEFKPYSGTFNTNGFDLKITGNFIDQTNTNKVINLGSSKVTIEQGGFIIQNPNTIVNTGTSTIYFNRPDNYSYIRAKSGQVFNNVVFITPNGIIENDNIFNSVEFKGNGSINSNNTFNQLTFSAGKTYTLAANKTQTINQGFFVSGNPCDVTTVNSSITGTKANVKVLAGNVSYDYSKIQDIDASGSYAPLNFGKHSSQGLPGSTVNINFEPYDNNAPIVGLTIFSNVLYSGSPITLTSVGFFPNPSTTYLWNDGSTGNSLVITKPGTYTLKVTYGDGCTITDSVTIKPIPPTINCIKEGDNVITGTGLPGANLNVEIQSLGISGTVTVDGNGIWTFSMSDAGSATLTAGMQISARQVLNGITSTTAQSVVLGSNDLSAPSVTSPQNFKPSINPNPTVANLLPQGGNIRWYDVATGGTPLNNTVLLQPGYYYVSQVINNCESSRAKVLVTMNENPCGKPGIISYLNNKIVGCTKVGYKNLSESTEITGIANPPTINGSFKYIINTGVVGRESDKFYKFENVAGTPVSTLPNQIHIQGKVVYDDASDHFYEATAANWVKIDN